MSKWLRPLTYALAAVCGIAAYFLPTARPVLLPIATALGGWASSHPADVEDKAALEALALKTATGAARATAALMSTKEG